MPVQGPRGFQPPAMSLPPGFNVLKAQSPLGAWGGGDKFFLVNNGAEDGAKFFIPLHTGSKRGDTWTINDGSEPAGHTGQIIA